MKAEALNAGYWSNIARQWEHVGPPLRPSAEDLRFVTDVIRHWAHDHDRTRALILGVTPEFYRLAWPPNSDLLAADRSRSMIDAVWPGPRTNVLNADWMALPLKPRSRDIVLCDGGLHLLAYPHGHSRLVAGLRNLIDHNGICVIRVFVSPAQHETCEEVIKDLLSGQIPNVNVLKLRLWMALHQSAERGVQLHGVWNTIRSVSADFERLAASLGWPLEPLLALNAYRNCHTRYHFLNVAEVRQMFCADRAFVFESIHFPTQDLGEQCPMIVLRRVHR